MKRYLPFIIVSAVAVITIAGGAMLYHAKGLPLRAISKNHIASGMDGAGSIHIRGQSDAPVTLEEYGDFECPPCGRLSEPINKLEQDYHSRLRVIFHHFPIVTHQHAREAALASEAAGLQGRFWEMHDVLYREQATWSKAPDAQPLFNAYAGMLGLKIDRFKKDMESDEVKEKVDTDQKEGAAVGVTVTPTIFINNRALPPTSLNEGGLRAAIEEAIKAKSAP
jgi:protein-disulfide isomerase